MLASNASAILIGQILERFGAPPNTTVCVYLLAVVVTASVTEGYAYGIISALISTLAYNYFIMVPIYNFTDLNPYLTLTFALMLVMSMLISSVTSKVREVELLAQHREEETNVLYRLTKGLAGVTSMQAAIEITLLHIGEVFQTDCRILEFDEDEKPLTTFILYENSSIHRQVPTNQNRDFSEYKVRPEEGYYCNDQQYEWPVYSQDGKILAAIAIPVETCRRMSSLDFKLMNTTAESCGITFEKLLLAKKQEKNKQEVSQERYRTNLLRSISHDLRTPLAGISGTSEVLMEQLDPDSEAYELASNIRKETEWLFNLVQNVLSLTRLQNEGFSIREEINVLEDVVDSAIKTMEIRLPKREFVTIYPDDVFVVSVDPSLIKQVIINLVDNASKYSDQSTPIEVEIRLNEQDPSCVEVHVLDHGVGFTQASLDKIFKMFYTTKAKTEGAMRGYGLGLPICDSIMKAHRGTITARNRADGDHGAEFIIRLPLHDPDVPPADESAT